MAGESSLGVSLEKVSPVPARGQSRAVSAQSLWCLCSTGPQGYDLQKVYRKNLVNVSAFDLSGEWWG